MAVPSDHELLELISRLAVLPVVDIMNVLADADDDTLRRIDEKCSALLGPDISLN